MKMTSKNEENFYERLSEASGEAKVRLFIQYCNDQIRLKDTGEIREEDAAYNIVEVMCRFKDLSDSNSRVLYEIWDSAAEAEKPRETSYSQPIGSWNEKTANIIKKEEWNKLVVAVKNAENTLK